MMMGGVSLTFGQKVYAKRKEMGLTQEQLGKLLNISGAAVCMYESDTQKPHKNTMPIMCKVFHCTPDDLADDLEEVHGNDRNSDTAGNG